MALPSKPIPADPELMALLEKSKGSSPVSTLLRANPSMSREYATGYIDGQASGLQPHQVAEQIATAIAPTRSTKARRDALNWAAQVARSMFPKPENVEAE